MKYFVLLILVSSIYAYDDGRNLIYNFNTGKWENKFDNGARFIPDEMKYFPQNSPETLKDELDTKKDEINKFKNFIKKVID